MQLKALALNAHLSENLANVYLVFGAEILLIEQSISQIIKQAKSQGFEEKTTFSIEGNFDWNPVYQALSSNSLFSTKRIIHLRLGSGKIGVKGSKALSEIAGTIDADTLLLVSTNKLDMAQQKSKWFKTLDQQGFIVQHFEVRSDHLVGWIANHMDGAGLQANQEVAQAIAFCTEGNLLASMQEIEKLKLAYPDGVIDTKDYLGQIHQQSKYSIYGLIDAALLGDAKQVLKIYNTLKDDTSMPIKLSFSLYQQLSSLIEMAIELQQVKNIDSVMQSHRVWTSRKPLISNTLKRFSYAHLQKLLLSLGRIDRSIKGMDNLEVVDEIRSLLLTLSGKSPWAQ